MTAHNYYITGIQDCMNALSIHEFRINPERSATEIVDEFLASDAWEDQASWIEQIDPEETLPPDECYQAWRDGWRTQAIRIVARYQAIKASEPIWPEW